MAIDHGLSQHASDHRAATPSAAWASTDSGSFADGFKRSGACLNRFQHGPSADLVAEARGLKVIDDRLFFALLR
jgi:hypothetical protein